MTEHDSTSSCAVCHGTGMVPCFSCAGAGYGCSVCAGTGRIICRYCSGTARIRTGDNDYFIAVHGHDAAEVERVALAMMEKAGIKKEKTPKEKARLVVEDATVAFIKALPHGERITYQEWLAEVARLHPSTFVRRSAMVALRDIGSPLVRPISLLIIAHEEQNENLRETAIKCLGQVGIADDLALLQELQENEQIARFGKQAAARAYAQLAKRLKRHGGAVAPRQETATAPNDREPYFDVALSFAGEDRNIAATLANGLRAKSLRVFYDMFYQADLIGEDLSRLLAKIYRQASRFCVVLISKHYPQKSWPKFELSHAQDRAIFGHSAYLIPVRLDSTPVDSISATVAYIDLRHNSIEHAVELITEKIKKEWSGNPRLSEMI